MKRVRWAIMGAVGMVMGLAGVPLEGGEPVPLWPEGPPLGNGLSGPEEATPSGVKNVSVATLTPFLVAGAERPVAAVVVVPGGGYGSVCTLTEGNPPAEWLVKRGIAAFVLTYRLPNGNPGIPLQDARKAIRLVRSRAAEWNIAPDRVGIWGFSAGGHLAATVATAGPDEGDGEGNVGTGEFPARPDFAILFYPVISMDGELGHVGSRRNLTGSEDSGGGTEWSADTRVGPGTPPAFLLHAADDRVVLVEHSLRFFAALRKQGIAAECHVYETGGHGPGAFLTNPSWEGAAEAWMKRRGIFTGADPHD